MSKEGPYKEWLYMRACPHEAPGHHDFLFENFSAILAECSHDQRVWSAIASWPVATQSMLFLKHSLSPRAVSLILEWPTEAKIQFVAECAVCDIVIVIVRTLPLECQQTYYAKAPPQYGRVVDEEIADDDTQLFQQVEMSRAAPSARVASSPAGSPEYLATRAFFMAGYTVPSNLAPAVCGEEPMGYVLSIGFQVYSIFHGHKMNPVWFKTVMDTVITHTRGRAGASDS